MNIHASSGEAPVLPAAIGRSGFQRVKVLIIGDVMLDRYMLGDVTRISPEAPVPVLQVQQERMVAGGAANVALNVAGLRAQAYLVGVIGDDAQGVRLSKLLEEQGIDVRGLTPAADRPTTCKTRVMCGNHQIVRLDEESTETLQAADADRLLASVRQLLAQGMDSVILSDYAKGVLGRAVTEEVIALCLRSGTPVLVDPKRADYTPYARATCITPNQKEFKAASLAMSLPEEDFIAAGFALRERMHCDSLLVTQGAHGMTLFTSEHSHHLPALAEEVFDVSGAGDTVIATLATCLGAKLDMLTGVQLSNVAASLVVRRAGTAPVVWDDLQELLALEREHQMASAARVAG